MVSKNELKYYSSLLRKKERDADNKFIAEGKRLVEEGLKSSFHCEIIIYTEAFFNKHEHFHDSYTVRAEIVSEKDFAKLSDTEHPQGILGVFQKPKASERSGSNLIVLLDNISDPGNAGTILRNCDWFGATEVVFSENCVDPYNPKVVRSSMGSLFHLDITKSTRVTDVIRELKRKSYTILCADMEGTNLYDFNPREKTVLILSSEAFGPSKEIMELSDIILTIPKKGKAESLNVASASSVILSHLTK